MSRREREVIIIYDRLLDPDGRMGIAFRVCETGANVEETTQFH